MATFTPDKVAPNTPSLYKSEAEFPAAPQDSKAHTGPVARLLARVSKWSGDYADYQMEVGVWRKLAL